MWVAIHPASMQPSSITECPSKEHCVKQLRRNPVSSCKQQHISDTQLLELLVWLLLALQSARICAVSPPAKCARQAHADLCCTGAAAATRRRIWLLACINHSNALASRNSAAAVNNEQVRSARVLRPCTAPRSTIGSGTTTAGCLLTPPHLLCPSTPAVLLLLLAAPSRILNT